MADESDNEVGPDAAPASRSERSTRSRTISTATSAASVATPAVSFASEIGSNSSELILAELRDNRVLQVRMNSQFERMNQMFKAILAERSPPSANSPVISASSPTASTPSPSLASNLATVDRITIHSNFDLSTPSPMASPENLIFNNSTPIGAPTVASSPSTTTVKTLQISTTEHKPTPPNVLANAAKIKMRANNSAHHSEYFLEFKQLLEAANLTSLSNGTRPFPTTTPTNRYGFTEDYCIQRICPTSGKTKTILIERDDIGLHCHDLRRLMAMLREVIDKDIHFQMQVAIESENAVDIFHSLSTYVNGQSANDITIATNNLNKWILNPKEHFAADSTKLLELFRKLEHAQKFPIGDDTKHNRLSDAIFKDSRMPLRTYYQICLSRGLSFSDTLTSLVMQMNALPIHAAVIQTTRMARFETKEKSTGICYKFQSGSCVKGDKCIYRHKIDPEFKKKSNTNSTKSIAGPLTRDYRQDNLKRVGPPKHPITSTNPTGLSKQQFKAFTIFKLNEAD